tara:strand:+ start:8764 stop:9732 length:969 start_codon:yes stop_codon:yes gene_type:complete
MQEEQNVPISNDDFLNAMKNESNRDPDVSQEKRDELTDELRGMKDEYANGNKKDQANLESELIEKAQSMTQPEQFKKEIASTLTDVINFGHDPVEKLGPFANDIMKIMDGGNPVIYKDKKAGHEMSNGNWMSYDNIIDMLNGMKVDQASKGGLKVLLDDAIAKAEEIQPDENSEFNYQKEYNNIKEKIVESGNIKSLTVDKMFGNRVFKDDLISAIQKGTYKEMGVTDDQIKDPTPEDGKITEEDAKAIYGMITKDETMLKDYLTEYFTKAIEQNYNNNLSPEVRRNKKVNQAPPQATEPVEQEKPQALPLYDLNVGLNTSK